LASRAFPEFDLDARSLVAAASPLRLRPWGWTCGHASGLVPMFAHRASARHIAGRDARAGSFRNPELIEESGSG
jgi:hypothetical protein